MPDLRARFNTALKDTVDEWKKHGKVKGIFVYGSFARGTLTATSDLDLGIIWDDVEPPAQLLSEHKAIRIDLTFLSTRAVKDVFEGRYTDPMIVADVVGKLKTAQVVHDKDGSLKKWQKTAAEFVWSEEAIENMKERASLSINSAMKNAETEDTISAIHDLRNGLFDLGRVIVMKNNIFSIMKPSEVLTEIRMLDPLAYPLFLRTFKLKGMEEEELMDTLTEIEEWINMVEFRFSEGSAADYAADLIMRVRREYHGAMNCTVSGDYELAVLEMRRAVDNLGRALLAVAGQFDFDQTGLIQQLKENEPVFYENIMVRYGAFDFTQKGVERSIGEARFIAQRL